MADQVPADTDDHHEPWPGHGGPFVPDGFVAPPAPRTKQFFLEPLGPQHNEADYAAWTSSVAHIHATPGFERRTWPHAMSLEDNLADLIQHADHFARRLGFTYTVRDAEDGDVVGCVYIYPDDDASFDAKVRSWVRASRAEWDVQLAVLVDEWLRSDVWPFGRIRYR